MDTKKIADLIIREIKKNDIFGSTIYGSAEMKDALTEFNRIYEQANSKAFVENVPSETKFRFIKRVIGKLIRTYTNQQTEFNYKIMELIKYQQILILKNMKLLEKLKSTNDN